MECQDCVDSVSNTLKTLPGIRSYEIDLENQSVLVNGTIAPSKLTSALRDSGRAAILRGSGDSADGLGLPLHSAIIDPGAAVCILDIHRQDSPQQDVRGLVRLVQLPSSPLRTFVDVTLAAYTPGRYQVILRSTGDLTRGVASAGPASKILGEINVDDRGWGSFSAEIEDLQVWEVLGRAISVDQLVGVVARSAGIWENVKKVCACSGRTIWEEHQVMAQQTSVL
jgi:copper chaperone for superoxide dismutase